MTNSKVFEFFVGHFRIGIVEAANLYDAIDRAIDLCPGVDWRQIVVRPTTYAQALHNQE